MQRYKKGLLRMVPDDSGEYHLRTDVVQMEVDNGHLWDRINQQCSEITELTQELNEMTITSNSWYDAYISQLDETNHAYKILYVVILAGIVATMGWAGII